MNPEPLVIADWLPLVPGVLVAAAVLVLPGLAVVAATTRLRPWTVALSPAISIGLIGVGATMWGFTRLRFSLVTVLVMTAAVSAVALLVRMLLRADGKAGEATPSRAQWLWAGGGVVVGGLVVAVQMVRSIGVPSAVSQTFDAIFHVNAVHWVVTSGTGSVFGLGDFTGNAFYPMGWHDLTAVVVQLTGLGVPEAISATNIAIAAVAWPAGCAALVSVLLPGDFGPTRQSLRRSRAWMPALAAVLAAGFGAFPFRLIEYGVVYPNFLSVAILPATLAAVVRVLRLPRSGLRTSLGADRGARGEQVMRALMLVVACSGLGLAQPNGLMSLVAMSVPLVIWAAVGAGRDALRLEDRRGAVRTAVLAVVFLAVVATVWQVARPPAEASTWPPNQTLGEALGLGLTVSPWDGTTAWVVVCLMVAGLITLVRYPRYLRVASPFGMALLLYVVVSAGPSQSALRSFLTGVYFNDTVRIAALLPVGAVVVCALGAERLLDVGRAILARVPRGRSTAVLTAGAVVLGLVFVYGVALDNGNVDKTVQKARRSYAPSGSLLTPDERAILEALPKLTTEDGLVAGNPNTGAALAFALGDRDVTEPHGFSTPTNDEIFLAAHMNQIEKDPLVCDAVERAGVSYVLDFGTRTVLPWPVNDIDYSGYTRLKTGRHLELLKRAGSAALFRVEC